MVSELNTAQDRVGQASCLPRECISTRSTPTSSLRAGKMPALLCVAILWTTLNSLAPRGLAADSSVFNVVEYGAKGDGTNNDTAAIQKALDACGAAGGGQVLLPSGRIFLTGALTVRSGTDFHLDGGAMLKGSSNWRDYGRPGALLFAKDAHGITVSGNGIIDGNDREVWQTLANEEVNGDVNNTNWWPQSFTGDWW